MYCKNCGEKIENGAKFCPKCGAEIDEPAVSQQKPMANNDDNTLVKVPKLARRYHINAVVLTCVALGMQIVPVLFFPSTLVKTLLVGAILVTQLVLLTTKKIEKLKFTSAAFLGLLIVCSLPPIHSFSNLPSVFQVVLILLMAASIIIICLNKMSLNKTLLATSVFLNAICAALLTYSLWLYIDNPDQLTIFHQIGWVIELVTIILIEAIINYTYVNNLDPEEFFRKEKKNTYDNHGYSNSSPMSANQFSYSGPTLGNASKSSGLNVIANVLWAILGGLASALMWLITGALWCITIIGIPLGKQCFKFAKLTFAPFGKDIVYTQSTAKTIVNIIWILFTGLWYAAAYALLGVAFCVTIIGIPFGMQYFKFAKLMLMPFGAKIIEK